VLGKLKRIPEKLMLTAHKLIWLGLCISISSGALLFWELREYLLTVPAFYTKIFFVVALVINSLLISRHLHTALNTASFSLLSTHQRRSFLISGVISTISWGSVVLCATLLGV